MVEKERRRTRRVTSMPRRYPSRVAARRDRSAVEQIRSPLVRLFSSPGHAPAYEIPIVLELASTCPCASRACTATKDAPDGSRMSVSNAVLRLVVTGLSPDAEAPPRTRQPATWVAPFQ